MEKEKIKFEVLEYIKSHSETSFVEIERIFEKNEFDYVGDGAYSSGVNNKAIFWIGWNKAAYEIISELKREGLIVMEPCQPIIYVIDGKSLTLPIMKSMNIKNDHWLPVAFSVA